MSTSSSTRIQTQLWTIHRRPIQSAKSEDRDDHRPKRSVTPAQIGTVVAFLLSQNGHWAMASASGRRRRRGQ